MSRPLVIIESPYAGDITRNVAYAERALLDSLHRNEAPFASHLLYTRVLDDTKFAERHLGISAGLEWRRVADYAAFYIDYGWSPGMKEAKALYDEEEKGYEIRSLINNTTLIKHKKPISNIVTLE